MGRVNKTIEGVFIDIVGTSVEMSSYDQFLNLHGTKEHSKELKLTTESYGKLIAENKLVFEKLAALEEVIIQMRIRESLDDIKLTLLRDYIYARTPFYRKDKKSKDVRVIVDKIDLHDGATLEDLYNSTSFMEKAKTKLGQAMDVEISENLRILKTTH